MTSMFRLSTLALVFLVACGKGGSDDAGDDDDDIGDDDDDIGDDDDDIEPRALDLPVDVSANVPFRPLEATAHFVNGNLTVYLALENESDDMFRFPQLVVEAVDRDGNVLEVEEEYLKSTVGGYYVVPGDTAHAVIWFLDTVVMPSSLNVRYLELDVKELEAPETEVRSVEFGGAAAGAQGWVEAEICLTPGSTQTSVGMSCDVIDGDGLGFWNLCIPDEIDLDPGETCGILVVNDLTLPADPEFLIYPWH